MSNSNNIISSPVSLLADLHPVLGVVGSLNTVSRSSNINPLAKYKPVNLPGLVSVTDAQRRTVNFGTAIPELSISSGLPEPGDQWYHAKPVGDYRILDFNGYSHDSVPPVAIGWNSGTAGGAQPVDWANSDAAAVNLFVGRSSRHHVTGGIELDDLVFGNLSIDALYFWVALMSGNNLYLKRSDRTLAQIVAASAEVETVIFYIRSSGGHSADFSGELAGIADDYTFQVFVAPASSDGVTSGNIFSLSRLFSLNCRGGMDVKDFGNVVAPWYKNLSVTVSTDGQLVYQNTGAYRLFQFTSNSIANFVRGAIEEASVQGFVYRAELKYYGTSGGFPTLGGYSDSYMIIGGSAISVPASSTVSKTIGLSGISVYATIGEVVPVVLQISGARTAGSAYQILKSRTYAIMVNNQIYIS